MTATKDAPLFQVGIRREDDEPAAPITAWVVVHHLHKQLGSLRTVPDPKQVDTGVFLVLLPAGLAAKLEREGHIERRVRVGHEWFILEAVMP